MKTVCLILFAGVLGASERGVEILWDRYGVAHVYAKDTTGMYPLFRSGRACSPNAKASVPNPCGRSDVHICSPRRCW
jgi:hypothetical protein